MVIARHLTNPTGNMKLWTSGEIQADVADAYRTARRVVENAVNEELRVTTLDGNIEEWAFLAIIRTQDHPDYNEIARRDARRKVLEFRLIISHREFVNRNGPHNSDQGLS